MGKADDVCVAALRNLFLDVCKYRARKIEISIDGRFRNESKSKQIQLEIGFI